MAIKIKKSKVGTLHTSLGISKDKKIPVSRLRISPSDSPALVKKKTFANNARKWHHADGGATGDPTSNTVVTNNLWTAQTRKGIYPYLARKGLLGQGADSLTMEQWNKLSPDKTLEYMKQDKELDYTIGNTANPGNIKYWSMDKIPAIEGKSLRSRKYLNNYQKAKKKTKYVEGGELPVKDPMTAIYGELGNMTGDFIQDGLMSLAPGDTDWRENPLGDTRKRDALSTAGGIGKATAKGAGTGAAIGSILLPGPGTAIGAALGAGIGAVGSGVKALFTSKKKKKARTEKEMNWASGMASLASSDNTTGSYVKGGEVKGSGTAKSDSIEKKVEDGSFIVPAENADIAKEYGKLYLDWKGDETADRTYPGTEVKLSNGEVLFTPEESDILRYHGINLDELAPNANKENNMAGGGMKGKKYDDAFADYKTQYLQSSPGADDEEIKMAFDDFLSDKPEFGIKIPKEKDDTEKSTFARLAEFAPEIAGAIQIGAAAVGNQKAGEMPDVNTSEALRSVVAETRKEAQYGLEPGARAAMENQTEKARRDATNAIVSRGGSSSEVLSNLQSVLGTTIDKKYNIELNDVAEKARKKSLYYGAKTRLSDQQMDVKKIALGNWKDLQEINAGLLSAGISNIVGARKYKATLKALKETGSDKATFTVT